MMRDYTFVVRMPVLLGAGFTVSWFLLRLNILYLNVAVVLASNRIADWHLSKKYAANKAWQRLLFFFFSIPIWFCCNFCCCTASICFGFVVIRENDNVCVMAPAAPAKNI